MMNAAIETLEGAAFTDEWSYTDAFPVGETDPRWSRLDDIERARLDMTIPETEPDVHGEGFCFFPVGNPKRQLNLTFVGHRQAATVEDPDELMFDARGIVWASAGERPHPVLVAGHAQLRQFSPLRCFVGTARVVYEQACVDALAQRFTVRGIVTPPRRRVRHQRPSRAWDAYKDLGNWLQLNADDVAEIVGVGRTTPYTWKRGREPRPETARKLFHLHGVIRALHRHFGDDLVAWLGQGSPGPLKLLVDGKHRRFERLAAEALLPQDEHYRGLLEVNNSPLVESNVDAAAFEALKRRRSRRLAKPLPIK
jgi:hypothetical protein